MANPPRRQLFSAPEHDRAIMTYWEKFMSGGAQKPSGVRALIEQSWRRCHGAVDHRRAQAAPPIDEESLERLRDQRRDLIAASAPVMATARDFLRETGTVMVLTDAKAMVLALEGDRSVALRNATETIHLMPGADWSEGACGTNAIGTALETGQPIQVHSTEHFCEGIKRWSCSASVIRDPIDRSILGVIDISGLRSSYSRHSMALVVEAASRIETELARIEMDYRARLLDRCFWEAPSAGDRHVVLFDRRGRAIKANDDLRTVLRELGAPPSQIEAGFEGFASEGATRGGGPDWLRGDWLRPVFEGDERLGAMLVAPRRGARPALRRPTRDAAPADACAGAAFADVVGSDAGLRAAVERARRVAPTAAPVLLLGETGVGKELFARNLHVGSHVAGGPFVALNCGGLSRDLLASELFGYADGAFTGARRGGATGKVEAARGGTLFLDEIGDMPIDLQPMFLRVLEEREVCRLGEATPRKVDFRLLCATNRDLRRDVERGAFRADLFYRISVVAITIPPLRARPGEIPALAAHFAAEVAARHGLAHRRFDPAALARLSAHDWPGNVRELRNVVESALLTAATDTVMPADLPPEITGQASLAAGALTPMETAERDQIARALGELRGNVTAVARALGLAKSTVYVKMRRYALDAGSLRA